jgi:hypothetical protein
VFQSAILSLLEFGCVALHEQANNESEQSEDRTEDLDNKDLDEPDIVLAIEITRERERCLTVQDLQHQPVPHCFR